ncbi:MULTISPECIES: LysR family transcriptional regulator [Klebsiella]|mgnify:FL=1|jgi:DNA-binding transcriptional LysR family regulator|uniref:Putative LysR-family transcriptional regulator n=1 Tax=Klebsiella aerogenes (strain ATCC 13048 / DSM 30053 / CCUG 1429 / JCM 1235 / KCTC 2190 / NBRC 13534 / NCIMB 10102 / NCTC 10006 / CDC 819-56) TaxID=1028307 RepID=A0A0H3FRN6_KLEAK|nr:MULTISPECIES: LysR family transcriptional regulator [Klebsiella]MCL6717894.1 LysR family transcriptional regulator [Klebsiella sp. T2.Ur]AEG98315.1 putative LysR-family transcriptional regulator [Klebsiella aerogenes KCTC 2190]AKK80775.1 LysR family transcriptional regulator [Klebsiella aerogenes]ATM91022.1 LysR family transcriptional regulator [Klebsiella aerogenes]ATX87434.1 LysR family transcriptional regulator [Klebsiella aerogenes]
MKLRHLEIFYAVMTCGSLSRAAESLNISQPAASKALKNAELKLGFKLFQRVRGKLLPSSEALTLFEKAQSIYQDLDNLRLLADNLARDPRAKITLGCLPSLGLSLVPELVTDFYQQNSNLVMTLTTEHTETLVKKLDLREIDLALTLQPVQQGEIITTLIAEVPLVYIDRDYRQGAVDIKEIDQQRWISPGPHSLSAAIATRRDFSTTRLNVQTYYMATEFVKRGIGCSITDIFSARHNLSPEMIHPITPPMKINLCLLRRADVSLSPITQKFVDFLCKQLRQQLKEINLQLYPDHKKSIAPLG